MRRARGAGSAKQDCSAAVASQPAAGRRWPVRVGLTAVLLLAAVLRLYHLDFGLPETVSVDAFKFVDAALHAVESGSWTPTDFQYPGLYTNTLAVLYRLLGLRSPYACHLAALLVSAIAGVLLVLVTHALARRLGSEPAALTAAALVAVEPGLVTQSRVQAPDLLMAVCFVAALAAMARWHDRVPGCAVAGALAGLATGAKLTGLVLLPFVVALPMLLWTARSGRLVRAAARAGLVLVAAILAFLVSTPAFPGHFGEYVSRFSLELAVQRAGQLGHVQGGYFDYLVSATPTWEQPWLGTSLLANLGGLGLAAILAGIGAGLGGRGQRLGRALALLGVAYLVLVSGPGRVKAYRFLLPVLPLLCALAAWAATHLLPVRQRRPRAVAAAVAAAALVAFPLLCSARYVLKSRKPGTNELASAWVEANVEPGTKVFLAPFFAENLARLPIAPLRLPAVGARQYRLPVNLGASPERDLLYYPSLVGQLEASGVRYAVLNSYFDDAFSPVAENLRFFPRSVEGYRAFRHALERQGREVFVAKGLAAGRLGPDISIFRLDQ